MNTLPSLPLDAQGDFTLLPINGHGSEKAAVAARMLTTSTQMFGLNLKEVQRLVHNLKGVSHHIIRESNIILVCLFLDKTCLVGQVHRQNKTVDLYPHPLVSLGKDIVTGLKSLNPSSWTLLLDTLKPYPIIKSKDALTLPGHHWPTWNTLDLQPLGPKPDIDTLIDALFHVLPQPKVFPQQRGGLHRRPTKAPPLIPLQIMGRKLGVQGPGPVSVDISPMLCELNPGWADPIIETITRLMNHPVTGDPLYQVNQRASEEKVEPAVIYKRGIPLDTSLSAHQRFAKAAVLPAGVLV